MQKKTAPSKRLELDRESAKKIAGLRIEEAKVLSEKKCFSGAYYLAGYSLELALKAVICKQFKVETIPDKKFVDAIYSHKLEDLMRASGLEFEFANETNKNKDLKLSWDIVTRWTENSRYEIKNSQEASELIEAISHQQYGILTWIQQHW